MLSFTSDQWVIVALIFLLGLLVGGFLFSGGGRKWKQRHKVEVERRRELEAQHADREREWREQDSLRAAALKDRPVQAAAVPVQAAPVPVQAAPVRQPEVLLDTRDPLPQSDVVVDKRSPELRRDEPLGTDVPRDRDGRPL